MPVHLMASGRLVRLEQVAGCGRWTSRSAMGGKSAALHPCAHCDITTQQQFKLRAWASTSGEAGVQSKDPRFCCGSSVLQRSALLHPSGPPASPHSRILIHTHTSPYRFPDSFPSQETFLFCSSSIPSIPILLNELLALESVRASRDQDEDNVQVKVSTFALSTRLQAPPSHLVLLPWAVPVPPKTAESLALFLRSDPAPQPLQTPPPRIHNSLPASLTLRAGLLFESVAM